MTLAAWLQLAQWLVMLALALWAWTTRKEVATATLLARVEALETKIAREMASQKEWQGWIGAKMSELATSVQSMPERFRAIFTTQEMTQQLVHERDTHLAEVRRRLTALERSAKS